MVTGAITTAGLLAAGIALLWALAEVVHARRVRRIGPLAFGPGQPDQRGSSRPASWVAVAPALRVVSAAALAFGLVALLLVEPAAHGGKAIEAKKLRHLVVVLDVSPSMRLADAGPDGRQTRRARAATLIRSVLARVPVEQYRVSVVAVANGALPVVEDTRDADVLANILDDLPLHFAFKAGKTDLFAGLAEAARIAKPWRPGSTTVLVVTDGDTVPATGLPRMPASVSGVLLVGVGDAAAGQFIDGHMSRQDAATLRQVAARSSGLYHDGNVKQVPTDSLVSLGMVPRQRLIDRLGLREMAMACAVAGAGMLSLLPVLLAAFGTGYRPGIPPRPRDRLRQSVVSTNSSSSTRRTLACEPS
jgi:Ca-activated chloride channel homolog